MHQRQKKQNRRKHPQRSQRMTYSRRRIYFECLEPRLMLTVPATIDHEFRSDDLRVDATFSYQYSSGSYHDSIPNGSFNSTSGNVNWTSPSQGSGLFAGVAQGSGHDTIGGEDCSRYTIRDEGSVAYTVNAATGSLFVTQSLSSNTSYPFYTDLTPDGSCPEPDPPDAVYFGGVAGNHAGTFDATDFTTSISYDASGVIVSMPTTDVKWADTSPTDFEVTINRVDPAQPAGGASGAINRESYSTDFVDIDRGIDFEVTVHGAPSKSLGNVNDPVADIVLTWTASQDSKREQLQIDPNSGTLGVFWNSESVHVVIDDLPEPPDWANKLEVKVVPNGGTMDGNTSNSVGEWIIRDKHLSVLTHGFNPTFWDFGSFRSNWVGAYPSAIKDQARQFGHERSTSTYATRWDSSSGWVQAFVNAIAYAAYPQTGSVTLPAIRIGMNRAGRLAHQAANTIVQELSSQHLLAENPANWQTIHLIGHSRGGAVNALASRLLANRGYQVDQYTALDGYSTDWPNVSGLLGDISIAQTATAETKANIRVGNGLAAVAGSMLDTILSRYLNRDVSGIQFTENLLRRLNWRAPERGFDMEPVLSGVNHLSVSDAYFQQFPSLFRQNPMVRAVESEGSPGGLDDSKVQGFSDGDFEQLAALRDAADAIDVDPDDAFLPLWKEMVMTDAYLLDSNWNITGDVNLVDVATGAAVELTQTDSTSISQVVQINANADTLCFDLNVLEFGAGDQLEVWYEDTLISTLDLSSSEASGSHLIDISAFRDSVGEFRFVLTGDVAEPARIQLDNLELKSDLSIARFEADPPFVVRPNSVVLTASGVNNESQADGSVEFYLESNGEAGLQVGQDGDQLLGSLPIDSANLELTVESNDLPLGNLQLYVQAVNSGGGRGPANSTSLQVADTPTWHNSEFPVDVDGLGSLQITDAFVLIEALRAGPLGALPTPEVGDAPPFVDVNDNGRLDFADAFLVIDALRNLFGNGGGEGELAPLARQAFAPTSDEPELADLIFSEWDDDDDFDLLGAGREALRSVVLHS